MPMYKITEEVSYTHINEATVNAKSEEDALKKARKGGLDFKEVDQRAEDFAEMTAEIIEEDNN